MSELPHSAGSASAPSGDGRRYHLAQLNVGVLKAPVDDPAIAEFVELLDPINAIADASPGFVWRLVEDGANDATRVRPFGADLLVNFSVWETLDALWSFTYRSEHIDLLRRRRAWFERMSERYLVLWWVPAGHIPSLEEAGERLALLREKGPTPEAFDFRTSFPSPEHDVNPVADTGQH